MAGFREAIALGLDGVELDVLLTKDQKLVVFHDLDTERLTGVSGKITEMTWAEIQQLEIKQSLNVGDRLIDYGQPEKIVLLENVLEATRGKLLVNIEIKAHKIDFAQRKTGAAIARLIKQMSMASDVFLTSFNFWSLWPVKTICRDVEVGLLFSPSFPIHPSLTKLLTSNLMHQSVGSSSSSLDLKMFTENTIKELHQDGLAVGAWTIFSRNLNSHDHELPVIESLVKQGIDYLITDDPVRLREFIKTL